MSLDTLKSTRVLAVLRAPSAESALRAADALVGVSPENIGDWFAAGAIAVGAGSDLVPSAALASEDWAAITRRAELFAASGVGV